MNEDFKCVKRAAIKSDRQTGTDTSHGSMEEALDQAEQEVGVARKDWQDIT